MDQQREKELFDLLDAWCEGQLTPDAAARLDAILKSDSEARWQYLCYMELHGALQFDPAALPTGLPTGCLSETKEVGVPGASEAPPQRLAVSAQVLHSPFNISRLALAAAVILAIGILAYTRWPGPAAPPVSQQPPAAKIANLTDAKWDSAFSPASGSVLTAGQRLILQSGSAEIAFNSQARVMLQGPAEIIIVDAAACRLAMGRLTAHVPDPAKGFRVLTPDGTVTDLGTDFGVYVKTGPEILESSEPEEQTETSAPQPVGKWSPVTEVHVFKGQVDVSRSEVGSGKSDAIAQNPTSDLRPPTSTSTSTILSAGEAVTISDNKVQPLPAADPFKFALDKLNGKSRQVLLAEDFETYDVGNQVKTIGPWIVQSGIRKGQGIHVYDPRAKLVELTEQADPVPNLSPAPAIGSRVAFIAAGAENPRDTFPLLAREIDGKLLTKNCQVLVEFDFMPLGSSGIQFSVALAAEPGHTSGVELWRDADESKKVACPPYQWYRLRVLLDVADGVVREVRAERSHWLSSQGWVRDLTFQPPTPKLDWSTPPRYAMFGFPVVSQDTPGGNFWLDNIRIEVISEQ